MKIVYDNAVDDIVDFTLYRLSPFLKVLARWIFPSLLAAYLIAGSFWGGDEELDTADRLVGNILAGLIFFAGWTWFIRWQERRLRTRFTSQGGGAVGRHELELTEDALIERTEVYESTYILDAVQRIVDRPAHTLIYVGPTMAHIIPHRGVITGEIPEFVEAVKNAARSTASE